MEPEPQLVTFIYIEACELTVIIIINTQMTISEISTWMLISKPWEPDQRLMRWPFAQDRHIVSTNFTLYHLLGFYHI